MQPTRGSSQSRGARHRRTAIAGSDRCRRKFLRVFPDGFRDAIYLDWERDYKWEAHERWDAALGRRAFSALIRAGEFEEIATRAVRVEGRTRHSMLFSFEKMALRDAVRTPDGARTFAEALFQLLYGGGATEARFERWVAALDSLPRRQTRVLTWPMATVWGFLAQPDVHIFFKPLVTRLAAERYGVSLPYRPRPNWATYHGLLELASTVKRDLADLRPRDMIDVQSFLWVQGSDEYS